MTFYQLQNPNHQKWQEFITKVTKEEPEFVFPGFATNAIHTGQEPEQVHGSVNVPIHYSSTFKQNEPGKCMSKFDYSRAGNPTVDALTTCFASLEHGKFAVAFSSGCAATTAVLMTLAQGDHVISIDDVYGGTNRLFNKIFSKFGLEVSMIHMTIENLEKTVKGNTKIIWIETPSNPMLKIVDIELVCKFAKSKGIITVVDGTFLSPFIQNPLLLGADIVLHSCTKFIGGHSDIIAGIIVTNNKTIYDKVNFNLMSLGGCISPFDAFILLRSIKTLKFRMIQHCRNGIIIARYLENHPKVKRVYYPGVKSSPDFPIVQKQMRHFGSVMSFDIIGDLETSRKFLKSVKLFTLAESLGGVESLIELPAVMTHASVPKEHREHLGITDTLIRVSVGLEDVEDLLNDLENAFSNI